MNLFESLLPRKWYAVRTRCMNCGHMQDSNIPKGESIEDWIEGDRSVCKNCGCNTLEQLGKK